MNSQQPPNLLQCSAVSELHLTPQSNYVQCSISPETPPNLYMQHTDSDLSVSSSLFPTDERRETIDDVYSLLFKLSQLELDCSFAMNGYKKINKICDTLQGKLYKSQNIANGEYVAIKKVDKSLVEQRITVQADETKMFVAENIVKEAQILKYLTVDNTSIGGYIVKYIDFFDDDESYYLVMEYIESEMNLSQFAAIAHQYIAEDKLRRKHYRQIIKYIYWQLLITIHWMHHDMRCSHLDLHTDNIMLQHCAFMVDKDGYLRINPSISIKLCDFGVAEIFDTSINGFACNKNRLSVEHSLYCAPNVYSEKLYDARCADMWSFGMIIYECLAGEPLYDAIDIWQAECCTFGGIINGYYALHNDDLKRYLSEQNKLRYFTSDSLDVLLNLLQIDERTRYQSEDVLQHKWFNMYFSKCQKQIERKTITQKKRILRQKRFIQFDFYDLN